MTSPLRPDKSKANKAVIEAIAKVAGPPKSAFSLVSGETERHKMLLVTGNPAALGAWVAAQLNRVKEN